MVIHIRQAASIPKENLDSLGQVEIPLGAWAAQLSGKRYLNDTGGVVSMGVWECSPGRWQRTIKEEEFAHFVAGSARFIPENGEPIDIKAGDTMWFPANSRGVWEISENVRKVYVVLAKPNLVRSVRKWASRQLSALSLDVWSSGGALAGRRAAQGADPAGVHADSIQKSPAFRRAGKRVAS
jgi:uncharacterized cupin superfamily protein